MQVNIKKYALVGFVSIAVLITILTAVLSGPSETTNQNNKATSEAKARSGMYQMSDLTDKSVEGAPNRKKFVQISFTADRIDFDYSVTLSNGQKTMVKVGGTTLDGVNYTAKYKRGDENNVDADEWICTFKGGSGYCLVPNTEGGINRRNFTKL